MSEPLRPGTHAGIRRELLNARRRVESLAYQRERQRQEGEPENTLQWHEVQQALGPYISPRIEDYEKIIAAAHGVASERLREKTEGASIETQRFKTAYREQLNLAILHNALFRVPAIGHAGWRIRRRLQDFIHRAVGKQGERLEILGRGENKVGYLEQSEPLMRQRSLRNVPYGAAVEKYGYPTDLVVKNRAMTLRPRRKRDPATWLIEVEPTGLKHLSDKIDILHRALARRLSPTAAPARQTQGLQHQLPEDASHLAIVFYTGSHPTLNDATEFLQDYQRENRIKNLPVHFRKRENKVFEQYQPRVLAGHDQTKLLEQQLNEILINKRHRQSIANSQYPVFWLVPVNDALIRIDLKKVVRMYGQQPDAIMNRPLYVPAARRKKGVVLQENLILPDLDALRKLGAARYVGTLRPATPT